MTDRARAGKQARAETFVVDRAWLKQEAREALKTFFAPFSGVYAAFKGDSAAR